MVPSGPSSVLLPPQGLIAFAEDDGVARVVRLLGEHDIATMAALAETLAEAVAESDSDIVVDLSGVEFMGAATVGVLARTRDCLAEHSRSLVLRSPSARAQRVLDLGGVEP